MAFTQLSCENFVEELASKAPVPGGGGASALVGAVGAALGNMVGSLTVGKKKYADVQEDILALKARTDKLQAEFLALVERDARAGTAGTGELGRGGGRQRGGGQEAKAGFFHRRASGTGRFHVVGAES